MARIRAIKPEFWSSPGHPADPWSRLLYIAMWNWADDAGVGTANLRELAGFAFPNDLQIVADCTVGAHAAQCADSAPCLRHMCAATSAHYGAQFYTVAGRHYYSIPAWNEHQKFDSRRKGKHPGPDEAETWLYQQEQKKSAQCADSAPTVRRHTGALTAPEQGNRGTGEQGNWELTPHLVSNSPGVKTPESKSVARMQDLNSTAVGAAAIEVAKHYTAWAGGGIDSRTRTEIAREVDPLLADGIDPRQIADGIKAWHESNSWSPTQLRRFVAKAARPAQPDQKPTKATLRAVDTMTAAEQIIAEMETA